VDRIASPTQNAPMKWYRRIELWFFLMAVLGVLAWVFIQRRPVSPDPGDTAVPEAPGSSAATAPPVTVLHSSLTRDYGNGRLDLVVRLRNDSAEKLVLSSPQVRLLTDKGREVPSFFLAFADAPTVSPRSVADVELRYWLDAKDLAGALRLEVNGSTVQVKGAKAFDLQAAKQGEKHTFQPADW